MAETTIILSEEQQPDGCDCLTTAQWNVATPYLMEFVGESTNIITTISVGLANVQGLISNLSNKETRITNIEGLTISLDGSSNLIIRGADNNIISQVSVASLNNQGTTFVYNATNETLELQDPNGAVLSTIPVSAFVSNFAATIQLGGSTLTLRDNSGVTLSSVVFNISNITGLQTALNDIEALIPINISQLNNDLGFISSITIVDNNANTVKHQISTVEGVPIYESVTALIKPTLVNNILTLKYNNENGVQQEVTVDLSGLVTFDINLQNASYNASTNIITLTENDNTTHLINLSEFSILVTANGDGTVSITQEGVVKITISKVGLTGEYGDLKNKPNEQDNEVPVITIPLSDLNLTINSTDIEVNNAVIQWVMNSTYNKLEIDTLLWEIVEDFIQISNGYVTTGYVQPGYVS